MKTDLLIETGTLLGGSALFFAQMFELTGRGKVISVDLDPREGRPQHARLQYLTGSSTDAAILEQLSTEAEGRASVMVILDSDHKAEYKLRELNSYARFVTQGSYLVAEDSCFDYYPAWPEYGPGPATAVRSFLEQNDDFVADRSPERHLVTFAPNAFLKRVR